MNNDNHLSPQLPVANSRLILWCGVSSCLTAGVVIAAVALTRLEPVPLREAPVSYVPHPTQTPNVLLPPATPAPVPISTPVQAPTPVAMQTRHFALYPIHSGEVRTYTVLDRTINWEVRTQPGLSYLVRLYDTANRMVMSVFVTGGTNQTVKVPEGEYIIRYASGPNWCGYANLFGEATNYQEADKIFSFESGYIYFVTLYTVTNGNLSTRKIQASDF